LYKFFMSILDDIQQGRYCWYAWNL
jgi:hypothetical protein